MSQKQRQASALKRQLENFQRDIRKERENIRACEEDFKIARDDNERLQIQTQKAAYEASVQVLEEDSRTMADVLKGLNEKEKEREEQIDREVQERFESMSMAERGAAGGDLGGTKVTEIDRMLKGLMEFASSLEGAAGRMGREERRMSPPRAGGGGGTVSRKTLGALPSFSAGSSDFILHLKSFKDFVDINDITDVGKIKRLFLNTFDQASRLRCTGIDPGVAPHNTSTLPVFYDAVRDLFIPKSEMQILRQAFYDHRQAPKMIAMDYMMQKWAKYKRAWENAPFSFFFENCTSGLYNEDLRHEVYRKVVDCDDPANETAMAAAFAEYVEHVQECTAYVRRVSRHGNPDHLGLAVAAQREDDATASNNKQSVREMSRPDEEGYLEQVLGEEEGAEEEEYELSEEQVAFVESIEDPFFTDMINKDPSSLEEFGDSRRCFICNSEGHIAKYCGQRLEMRKPFLRRAMGSGRGWRGGRRGRGGPWRPRGQGRGRQPPLSLRYAPPANSLASQARPVSENPKKYF